MGMRSERESKVDEAYRGLSDGLTYAVKLLDGEPRTYVERECAGCHLVTACKALLQLRQLEASDAE